MIRAAAGSCGLGEGFLQLGRFLPADLDSLPQAHHLKAATGCLKTASNKACGGDQGSLRSQSRSPALLALAKLAAVGRSPFPRSPGRDCACRHRPAGSRALAVYAPIRPATAAARPLAPIAAQRADPIQPASNQRIDTVQPAQPRCGLWRAYPNNWIQGRRGSSPVSPGQP